MDEYYCDSSSLVKCYVAELGTVWMQVLTAPAAGNIIYVARITGAEVVSAVTRRVRRGEVAPAEARQAISDFRAEFLTAFVLVEIRPTLMDRAMDLAEQYGLRGYDAVQLAAALDIDNHNRALGLPALTFISADAALNAVAQAEGLAVEDPNLHS